jgi:hypothetical protein
MSFLLVRHVGGEKLKEYLENPAVVLNLGREGREGR